MRKLIYKDEVYYFKRVISDTFEFFHNSLHVYIKRKGFWSLISPYKKIIGKQARKSEVVRNSFLVESIEDWLSNCGEEPLVIKCSPEITEIFDK